MQEYKREKNSLESQLREIKKATRFHDDHLRIIDAWFKQLIDEVKTMAAGDEDEDMEFSSLPSSLLFSDQERFEEHLSNRSNEIRAVITRLFGQSKSFSPEVTQLQKKISHLLAAEKDQISRLASVQAEKEDLESRLENASLRYMVAEKKIDRAKSVTVAKLEKQALLGGTRPSPDETSAPKKDESTVNGTTDNTEELAELEKELNKTVAASEKLKEQLDKLEDENSRLSSQITELSQGTANLTDEDYAKTELFKLLKTQYEDVVKKVNHLEATNTEVQLENRKLTTERTNYQIQLEAEGRTAVAEKDIQLGHAETNLVRIRSNRDELLADQAIKKAQLDQDRDALKKIQEYSSAQDLRIKSLESENERLSASGENMAVDSEVDTLGVDEVRSKYQELQRKYGLLNSELASMSTAFQKTSKIASQKITDYSSLEEKVMRLSAEKAKADQKFFAAMKSKDTLDSEVRTLRLQNTKSADVVTQLKEAEAASRALLTNLEKQVAELKDACTTKANEYRVCLQQNTTQGLELSRVNAQLNDLKQQLNLKDAKVATNSNMLRAAEVEMEELKSSLKDTRRSLELWKSKSGQSEQYEILRQFAYCNICKRQLKNTVIKTCGHTFCNDCVEERLTSRSRKCPNCGKSFGSNDHMRITL